MREAIAIHAAYKRGDLAGLKALLGDPPDFPNGRGPAGVGEIILEYGIYHAPLPFIRALLAQGADPNYRDHAGFPSLIAALSTDRADRYEIVELLLSSGAEIQQRGAERLDAAALRRRARRPGRHSAAARARRRPDRPHPHR